MIKSAPAQPKLLKLTVHLPPSNDKPIYINVPKTATVEDVIKTTLKQHQQVLHYTLYYGEKASRNMEETRRIPTDEKEATTKKRKEKKRKEKKRKERKRRMTLTQGICLWSNVLIVA